MEGKYCLGKVVHHNDRSRIGEAMNVWLPRHKERLVRLFPRRKWELRVVSMDDLVDFISGIPLCLLTPDKWSSCDLSHLKESIADAVVAYQNVIANPLLDGESKRTHKSGSASSLLKVTRKRQRICGQTFDELSGRDTMALRNEQNKLISICKDLAEEVKECRDTDARNLRKMSLKFFEERKKREEVRERSETEMRAMNHANHEAIRKILDFVEHISTENDDLNAANSSASAQLDSSFERINASRETFNRMVDSEVINKMRIVAFKQQIDDLQYQIDSEKAEE